MHEPMIRYGYDYGHDLRGETGHFAIHHVSEEETMSLNEMVHKHLMLPLKLLFLEPIVLLMTMYTSVSILKHQDEKLADNLAVHLWNHVPHA